MPTKVRRSAIYTGTYKMLREEEKDSGHMSREEVCAPKWLSCPTDAWILDFRCIVFRPDEGNEARRTCHSPHDEQWKLAETISTDLL